MNEVMMVRPNPELLAPHMEDCRTAGDVANLLTAICLDKPVVVLAEEGAKAISKVAAWGESAATTSKQVFGPVDASRLDGYLLARKMEFVAAFQGHWTPTGGSAVPVRAASRWAICARMLADLNTAISLKGGRGPFAGLPWVEVMPLLASPRTFQKAVGISLAAIKAKAAAMKGAAVAAWGGESRSGMDAAMAEACQVRDLVPAKDQAGILAPGEGDARLDDLEAGRLFEIMSLVVRANPAPVGALGEEFARAVGDFLAGASGRQTMRTVKAQSAWMRGLMPSRANYQPCAVCGFPAFFERDVAETGGKPERGWLSGKVLGAGWKPGTAEDGTVDVPICAPCRAEKIIAEDGLRAFGRHPIRLVNLGGRPIPAADLTHAYSETWGSSVQGEGEADLPSGGSAPFGDVGDHQVKLSGAISFATLRQKLSYAYLYLRSQGHDVALDLPGARHPIGVFGWVPPSCREGADPGALAEDLQEAFLRVRVSKLAMQGYGSHAKTPFERKKARERSLLTAPRDLMIRTLMDAVREMQTKPTLIQPILNIFTLNGGKPMRFANLNLLDEAVAWAEAAHPTLSTRREIYFNRGAATKAMSECLDQMMRTVPGERVGVAMAALTRNINRFLRADEAAKVPTIMADLQERLGRYAELSQAELSTLRNQLDPLIRAAIRNGVRYTPGQNNFCTRLKRRLNDPETVVVTVEDEPLPETGTDSAVQA